MTRPAGDGPDLGGLPAVVTGSSRGLGRAFAGALAAAGAPVVVNGTDPGTTESVAAAIRGRGGRAIACAGSVADPAFCQQLVRACVSEYGGIGLLVNNAGITRDRSLTRMTTAEFDEVVAVHLRGAWACGAAAARAMRAAGGVILNITSGAGLFGTFGQANYAAAKAGIVGLTRVMDLELGRFGIRVNALAPVARTDMTAVFGHGAGTAGALAPLAPAPAAPSPTSSPSRPPSRSRPSSSTSPATPPATCTARSCRSTAPSCRCGRTPNPPPRGPGRGAGPRARSATS